MMIGRVGFFMVPFVEATLYFILYDAFFVRRPWNKWQRLAGWLMLVFGIGMSNYFLQQSLANLLGIFLSSFLVLLLFFEGSAATKLMVAVLGILISAITENLAVYVMAFFFGMDTKTYMQTPVITIFGLLLSKIVALGVCMAIRSTMRKRHSELGNGYWLIFFLLFVSVSYVNFLMSMSAYEIQSAQFTTMCLLGSIGLFFTMFFALYLYEQLADKSESLRIQTQYEEHLKSQLKHLDEMLLQQKALRRFKHDVSNQLIALDGYLERQDYAGGRAYLHAVASQMPALGDTVDTGNTALDAILSTKMALAKSKGIDFTLKTQIPARLPVAPVDLCVIYGNTIDNAIEACDRVRGRKRSIAVSIVQEGTALLCQIANTAPDDIHPDLHTTKGDSDNHGFGLMNVRESLEKYGSELRIVQKDSEFILSFMIFLQAQPPEK